MDPRDFQTLAEKLASGTSPAEMRTAISRSYYAVYNVGVELLNGMGFRSKEGPSGHTDVEFKLSNSTNIEVEKIGSQLADLRSKRIQADYRLDAPTVEGNSTAMATARQAKRMIKTLDTQCSGPKRGAIIKGIEQYLRKIFPE